MIENTAPQAEEEEISIEITDEPVEGQEDELDRYTKSVSKRINKLNRKNREAEARAQQLEQLAQEKDQELAQYRQYAVNQQQSVLASEEQKLAAQESQVNDIYQRAVSSNDAGLMSKADSLKTDIAIKKEKLKTAKSQYETAAQQAQAQQQPESYQSYQPQAQAEAQVQPQGDAQEQVEPTEEALGWHQKNKWFGDQGDSDNWEATEFAYYVHHNLINEGYEPDSDEYYGALDSRVKKAYPEVLAGQTVTGQASEAEGKRPPVQRVASAPASGGRAKTRGNQNNGVKFSPSELERLQRLKPHNMTEEVWLKRVAVEKQKIAQREA
tara:strand:+ start:438 stop:1412 length:975 start_codon:yes stop_codon:yes gene_type:complete